MVDIEQVEDVPETSANSEEELVAVNEVLPSQERLLDAQEIEKVAAHVERPTARLHLTSLATKLRREAEALQRMEKHCHLSSPPHSPTAQNENADALPTTEPGPQGPTPTVVPVEAPKPRPIRTAAPAPTAATGTFVPVDRFSFDAGGYNAPFVTLYVDLPAVGSIDRGKITCDFAKTSFDLIVRDLQGKSYRLMKDNLEKDIDPSKSKIVVKADKIIIKLAKIKSEYGSYDYWSQLSAKKQRKPDEKDDPSKSIMQLMKDMYEDGDDNMRKVIGETMMKQQRGELGKDSPMGGGFDDL